MGKNSKLNKKLLNQYSSITDQELLCFLNFKIKQYIIYKKSCMITQEILNRNGYTGTCNFNDRRIDFEYSKLVRIAKLRNIIIDIPEEEIVVYKDEVIKRLNTLWLSENRWLDEHNYLFDMEYEEKMQSSSSCVELESERKKHEIYIYFNNIISNLSDEEIKNIQKTNSKALIKIM